MTPTVDATANYYKHDNEKADANDGPRAYPILGAPSKAEHEKCVKCDNLGFVSSLDSVPTQNFDSQVNCN
jgi:hypothetical protein